ncbi:uncharacterized protein LOC132701406 [Cylas formicarius]|uniref:uncharacterized protein LOC132701406 n=1 Tax=Cylas formicarius TaxID=197179 RepID=UPI00295832E3|nr:uncharacterized protein LOC132701406 [Cylas formicarius]
MSRLYGKMLRDLIEEDYKEKEEEEQCGFRAGRSCTDNVFTLKQIIEKRSARNLETHLTFVDLQKPCDTVQVTKLFRVLEQSNINHTYIAAFKELYRESKSRIRGGQCIAEEFMVNKGLRQRCCVSPTLFKIYVVMALKKLKRKVQGMGKEIDGGCLFTLQFADVQVIVANDKDDMQYMIRKLIEEYKEWGLIVNIAKTKYLSVGTHSLGNLELGNGQEILQCQEYEYLGITFDNSFDF